MFSPPSQIPGIEFRVLASVAFTAAAAYFDLFNNKWVPNNLVYAFLAAAILLNLVFFSQASLHAFAIGAAIFAISFLLYKAGQIGGADVFVVSAIAIALPYAPQPLFAGGKTAPYPFIISVLIPASIFFITHMLLHFLPYAAELVKNGKFRLSLEKMVGIAALTFSFAAFNLTLFILPTKVPPAFILLVAFLFTSVLFFSLFKKEIKEAMAEKVKVSMLQEEDVLALELMDLRLVKKLSLPPVISKEQISKLKAAKVREVVVYTKMPFFLPHLFLGLLFALLFGDPLAYLF
ncbi:MAG: hypothetical protein QXT25_00515 [Candidatus Anstonellaceae archaeon]